MLLDSNGIEATKGARSTCPACHGDILAKCGQIVAHHWAHLATDCDPWGEPETNWHLGWKRHLRDNFEAKVEVVMAPHRADVVLPTGEVIELQSSYLSVEEIAAREAFYGNMRWLYRCTWRKRLQFGRKGFWWKHGSKSMTHHQRPVWWDMGEELWKVRLSLVGDWICEGPNGEAIYSEPYRVVGQILAVRPSNIAIGAAA